MTCQKRAALTLDMKKQRIRIHKQTLHILGNPEYVQLLVNPYQKSIVLLVCPKEAFQAHKVTPKKDTDCELYSKELLRQLQLIDRHLEQDTSYLIYGQIHLQLGLVQFRLADILPIKSNQPSEIKEKGVAI